MEHLFGSFVSQAFTGALIDSRNSLTQDIVLAFEFGTGRQILPQQAIGILIGSPFPWMVWPGKVELCFQSPRNQLVPGELGAVVRGDRQG